MSKLTVNTRYILHFNESVIRNNLQDKIIICHLLFLFQNQTRGENGQHELDPCRNG